MEIPQEGPKILNEHIDEDYGGRYIFTATYTYKSGALSPLTVSDMVVLRPSKVEAERADVIHQMQRETTVLSQINNNSYFVLKNIDLKDVRQLTYRYSSKDNDAHIEVHTDAPAWTSDKHSNMQNDRRMGQIRRGKCDGHRSWW